MSSNPASVLGSRAILGLGKNLTGSVYRYLICVRGLFSIDVYVHAQKLFINQITGIMYNVKCTCRYPPVDSYPVAGQPVTDKRQKFDSIASNREGGGSKKIVFCSDPPS